MSLNTVFKLMATPMGLLYKQCRHTQFPSCSLRAPSTSCTMHMLTYLDSYLSLMRVTMEDACNIIRIVIEIRSIS